MTQEQYNALKVERKARRKRKQVIRMIENIAIFSILALNSKLLPDMNVWQMIPWIGIITIYSALMFDVIEG